jgi:hypothetical protein
MNRKTFCAWLERFPGIAPAIRNVSGGEITSALMAEIGSISVEPIDLGFLTASPIDGRYLYDCYISPPRIYVVWRNGQFCSILGEEAYNPQQVYIRWQDEIVWYSNMKPLALYLVEKGRYDVNYTIIVMRSTSTVVNGLKIIIHQPQSGLDLQMTALEIEAAFENGSWRGVEDLKSRFETGVGVGQGVTQSADPIFTKRLSGSIAGSIFKQRRLNRL